MAKIVTTGSIPEKRDIGSRCCDDFKPVIREIFPTLGMVATAFHWSDRDVYDIIAISKRGNKLTLRERTPICTKKPVLVPGGFCAFVKEDAEWRTEPNPDGDITHAFYSERKGRFVTKRGSDLGLDIDSYHYDYGF